MYIVDRIYKSLIFHMSQIVPSGVQTLDGGSYGVRTDNTSNIIPSVAVTLGDVQESPIELGSFGFEYGVNYTITATSRLQRDALKSIIMSGLMFSQIGVYTDFNGFVPASGAVVDRYANVKTQVLMRDMPSFETDRDRFFWVTEVFTSIDVLGL